MRNTVTLFHIRILMKKLVCLFACLYNLSAQATLLQPLTLKIVEQQQRTTNNDNRFFIESLRIHCPTPTGDKKSRSNSFCQDCQVPSPASSPVPDSSSSSENE